MKTLIVVDMQNDFISGSLGSDEAKKIVKNVIKKIAFYRKNNHQIIFTRDTHDNNYLRTQEGKNLPIEHCLIDTFGWQIIDDIEIQKYDTIVNKSTFGCDWSKKIRENELNIFGDEIEIIGLCTDICIISNAMILKSIFPETSITIDSNCCAGSTPENHKNALAAMKICQINII